MSQPKADVAGAKSRNKNLQRDIRRLIVGGLCFSGPFLDAQLLAQRRTGMFGEKLELITRHCCVCKTMSLPKSNHFQARYLSVPRLLPSLLCSEV